MLALVAQKINDMDITHPDHDQDGITPCSNPDSSIVDKELIQKIQEEKNMFEDALMIHEIKCYDHDLDFLKPKKSPKKPDIPCPHCKRPFKTQDGLDHHIQKKHSF